MCGLGLSLRSQRTCTCHEHKASSLFGSVTTRTESLRRFRLASCAQQDVLVISHAARHCIASLLIEGRLRFPIALYRPLLEAQTIRLRSSCQRRLYLCLHHTATCCTPDGQHEPARQSPGPWSGRHQDIRELCAAQGIHEVQVGPAWQCPP